MRLERSIQNIKELLPELNEISQLKDQAQQLGKVQCEGSISYLDLEFPVYSFSFGSSDKNKPCVIFTGGVHGLERIGTRVIINFLRTFISLLTWDRTLATLLAECRVLFYPLVNPVGMYRRTRSNAQGIDLMRNAPVDADPGVQLPLISGHRYSSKLPWYRGEKDQPMAIESKMLCDFIERESFHSKLCISVDIHSGFGLRDRLWFPYAKSKKNFPDAPSIFQLKMLLDQTYTHHIYMIEPQSRKYMTHGDLWDYLYEKRMEINSNSIYLPFTLELGSWLWVKKNPKQLFSLLGAFNPVKPHRLSRTLRRHLLLFEFLIKAAFSSECWSVEKDRVSPELWEKVNEYWYEIKPTVCS